MMQGVFHLVTLSMERSEFCLGSPRAAILFAPTSCVPRPGALLGRLRCPLPLAVVHSGAQVMRHRAAPEQRLMDQ